MNRHRKSPPNASIAEQADGDRLFAPSAARNAWAIADVLSEYAPGEGRALEIASGTGQHVAHLAATFSGLIWQPSEIDSQRRASIDSWAEAVANVRPAVHLDAATPGWSGEFLGQNLILLVNLLHLISTSEARTVISEAALALAAGGRFCLYGPFLREGVAISDGDARFDASLRAADPEIGYKDVGDVRRWLADAGLELVAMVDMPANNLTLIAECPKETS